MQIVHIPELRSLNQQLTRILPKLIKFMSSDFLRQHKVWGKLIPFSVESYGYGISLGHCVRPDIVLTEDGPIICELDFVPSGRGYLLSALPPAEQKKWLEYFANWYSSLGVSEVLYATASTTVCDQEVKFFAELLKKYHGINIQSINIDTYDKSKINGAFVDRLFYSAEMKEPDNLPNCHVATAEPWFDSKMIFAVIHDSDLVSELFEVFGADFPLLKKIFPYSIPVSFLTDTEIEKILQEKENWIIKSCDVEEHNSWGCRGTFMGASYSSAKFRDILLGNRAVKNKSIGNIPIVQHYHPSRDFSNIWNDIVDGKFRQPNLHLAEPSEETKQHAKKTVGGRFGSYFLINRTKGCCLSPGVGILTLRADRLVHGARDAFVTSCSF